MLSTHKFQLVKVEAEEEQISEVEEEILIEVEEAAHQTQVEGAAVCQVQVEEVTTKTQVNTHHKITLKAKGMTNPQSNVIIARNLGII